MFIQPFWQCIFSDIMYTLSKMTAGITVGNSTTKNTLKDGTTMTTDGIKFERITLRFRRFSTGLCVPSKQGCDHIWAPATEQNYWESGFNSTDWHSHDCSYFPTKDVYLSRCTGKQSSWQHVYNISNENGLCIKVIEDIQRLRALIATQSSYGRNKA